MDSFCTDYVDFWRQWSNRIFGKFRSDIDHDTRQTGNKTVGLTMWTYTDTTWRLRPIYVTFFQAGIFHLFGPQEQSKSQSVCSW